MKNINIKFVHQHKREEHKRFTRRGMLWTPHTYDYEGLELKVRPNGVTVTFYKWNSDLKKYVKDGKSFRTSLSQAREIYERNADGFSNSYTSTKIWHNDKLVHRQIRKGAEPYNYDLEYAV